MELGYNINNTRVFISGYNLATFSKFKRSHSVRISCRKSFSVMKSKLLKISVSEIIGIVSYRLRSQM